MTAMRALHEVLVRPGGQPVTIMKNSRCAGYFVPVEATLQEEPRSATMDEVLDAIRETHPRAQPHDAVLNPGEVQGFDRDKSSERALARVDNRLV